MRKVIVSEFVSLDGVMQAPGNTDEGSMATFVTVPGAWIGGWAWADVTPDLREQGHDISPNEELRARIRERAVPHPFGTYTQPLRLKNPDRAKLPHVFVSNGSPIAHVKEFRASGHPWFAGLVGPQWSPQPKEKQIGVPGFSSWA